MSSEVYPLDLWTSIFALKHSILIALGLPPFDEVCEPFFLDRRDGEDPVTDVGGSGRFLWGSQDPSLDSSYYPDPLSSSSLDSCDFGFRWFLRLPRHLLVLVRQQTHCLCELCYLFLQR